MPSPADIRSAMAFAGHTQPQMARCINVSLRTVEAWLGGTNAMDEHAWIWYRLVTNQHPDYRLVRRRILRSEPRRSVGSI